MGHYFFCNSPRLTVPLMGSSSQNCRQRSVLWYIGHWFFPTIEQELFHQPKWFMPYRFLLMDSHHIQDRLIVLNSFSSLTLLSRCTSSSTGVQMPDKAASTTSSFSLSKMSIAFHLPLHGLNRMRFVKSKPLYELGILVTDPSVMDLATEAWV